MVEESYFDDLDRKCFNASAQMAHLFSHVCEKVFYRLWAPLDPNKFDNATSKVKEIAARTFIVLGIVFTITFMGIYLSIPAVILGTGSKAFRAAACYFQKDGFTHIQGRAAEKAIEKGAAKVLTWNICGQEGGLHYDQGVVHWRNRIDQIVSSLTKEAPDVLVLEGIDSTDLTEALVERLGDQYAHIYAHTGAQVFGSGSGIMVFSKLAVSYFSHNNFLDNHDENQRGFSILEVRSSPNSDAPSSLRIVATELTPGKEYSSKRMDQLAQIINQLAKQTLELPTLVAGSFHMDRDDLVEGGFLARYFYHSYLGNEATYSNKLSEQWKQMGEIREFSADFISLVKRNLADGRVLPHIEKGVKLRDSHIVKGIDDDRSTQDSLSSHHGISTTISGAQLKTCS